jgi:hypothetical protein
MSVMARYLKKLYCLNQARLVPDRILISPEAFHQLQAEVRVGDALFYELENFGTGLRETLFGLPATIDPRLTPGQVSLEIDL